MKDTVMKKRFLSILAVGILIGCAVGFNQFRAKIDLPKMPMKKTRSQKDDDGYAQHVKCRIVSTIGLRKILIMEIAIPYENMEQHRDLKRKMKKIKSDFLVSFDQKEMGKWVRQRNFEAIKSKFLKMVNRHTDQPVEDLYFVTFNFF